MAMDQLECASRGTLAVRAAADRHSSRLSTCAEFDTGIVFLISG